MPPVAATLTPTCRPLTHPFFPCSDAPVVDRLGAAYRVMQWRNGDDPITRRDAFDYVAALRVRCLSCGCGLVLPTWAGVVVPPACTMMLFCTARGSHTKLSSANQRTRVLMPHLLQPGHPANPDGAGHLCASPRPP